MTKYIIIIFFVLGCAGSIPEQGNWCYLTSGLYLICGDVDVANNLTLQYKDSWPRVGYIDDVFMTYNNNDNLELFIEYSVTQELLWSYLDKGYNVAIVYKISDTMNHSEPLINYDIINVNLIAAYIAYEI